MGVASELSDNMKGLACFSLLVVLFSALHGRPQREEPQAQAGCDPDFGWHNGADGSGKCYRLVKASDYTSCGTDFYTDGMSWFNAMECCYWNKGYLAEPQNQAEQDKIVEYITAADGGTLGLTAYWLGANDVHREGSFVYPSGQPMTWTNWMDGEPNDSEQGKEDCVAIDSPKDYKWMTLNCTDNIHGAVTHWAVCERIPPQIVKNLY